RRPFRRRSSYSSLLSFPRGGSVVAPHPEAGTDSRRLRFPVSINVPTHTRCRIGLRSTRGSNEPPRVPVLAGRNFPDTQTVFSACRDIHTFESTRPLTSVLRIVRPPAR